MAALPGRGRLLLVQRVCRIRRRCRQDAGAPRVFGCVLHSGFAKRFANGVMNLPHKRLVDSFAERAFN